MKRREADVKELRDNLKHQINRYNKLCTTHDSLLMEAQGEQMARMAGSRVQVVRLKEQAVRLEVLVINPRGQEIGPEAGIVGSRGRAISHQSIGSWLGRSRG